MASLETMTVNFTLNTISLLLRPKIANGYLAHLNVQMRPLSRPPRCLQRLRRRNAQAGNMVYSLVRPLSKTQ